MISVRIIRLDQALHQASDRAARLVRAVRPLALAAAAVAALVAGTAADGSAPQAASSADTAGVAAAGADTEDVWVVSTRRLPDVRRVPEHAGLDVERLDVAPPGRRWVPADVTDLLGDPHRPLVLFIHGNRYDTASAKSQGLSLARATAAARPHLPPARTVIFSWPSSQEGLLLRDSRAKYERALSEGHYLAWLLGRVDPAQPVAIVAYSYGALITLEAVDHLVRAEQSGRGDLHGWTARPGRVHLVFAAAAVRQDALAPGGEYRRTVAGFDRLTLLNNTRDRALAFFECIDRSLRTEALGREHMPARWLPPTKEFVQVDAAGIVGGSHRFPPYLESSSLRRRLVGGAMDGLTTE